MRKGKKFFLGNKTGMVKKNKTGYFYMTSNVV